MKRLALLFDLDGTLLDSIELLLQSMEFCFDGSERKPTRAEWTAGIGTPLRAQLAEWATSDADRDRLLDRYREFQSERLESLTSLYPGARELLEWAHARGHALAIVTSKGRGMTERSLTHLNLATVFDAMVTVESTTRHKPLADPVLRALELLALPTDRALFVGDSPHDMNAGKAAGVTTAAALWGPFSRDELEASTPSYWLESMNDLRKVVEKLEANP